MNVQRVSSVALIVVALAMVAYHLLSTLTILQPYVAHVNTHIGFCLALVFLAGLAGTKGKKRLWYLFLVLLSLMTTGYVQMFWEVLQERTFFNTATDLVIGGLLIILVIEATRQHFGPIIPILVCIIVAYPFLGTHLPEPFYTRSLGLEQTISQLSIGLTGDGVIGQLSSISLQYVFLFVVFGGILQASGAVTFFMNLAKLAAGKLQGGPALVAVVSSALVGSLSGSTFANVAITGSFTIPIMKNTGYKSEQAGAIEAAASTGGQIMPPVMGIGAFVMAGMTDIPYIQICAMAIIPAIIYYLTVGTYVYIRAGQLNIGRMKPGNEKVDTRELLLEAPKFIIPFAVIVALLMAGFSVMYAGFWAIVSSVAVALIRKKTRPSIGKFIDGFTKGAVGGAGIGASMACISMLAATFTMTGLGIKLTYGMEQWSGGYLLAGLAIIWTLCILLGAGGIGFATYIVISIFAAPALVQMGVPFIQAHFFIFFATVFVGVTPPMAPAAIIGSKLAQASYMRTAFETLKIAAVGLLLPFAFVYAPIMLLQPVNPYAEIITLISFVIALLALQTGSVGYFLRDCSWLERILLLVGGLFLLVFVPVQNYILFAIGMGLPVLVTVWQWRKSRSFSKES